MSSTVFRAAGLVKVFGGIRAVDNVSFDLEAGSVTALIGPNGAGKTTVFNLLSGLLKADSGEVYFLGKNVTGLRAYRLARLGIGRTFQSVRLFERLSSVDNLLLAGGDSISESLGRAIFRRGHKDSNELRRSERAWSWLRILGLESRSTEEVRALSHAERRLLEIARVLVTSPRLVLLDEPVAGLSRDHVASVVEVIRRLKSEGAAVLLIEHDMRFAMSTADHVIVLNFGRKICEGRPQAVVEDKHVIEAYLGKGPS